jgi:uncharacterized tellurite resistance protein B-like protein
MADIHYTSTQREAIVSLVIEMINIDSNVAYEELDVSNKINELLGVSEEEFVVGKGLDLIRALYIVSHMTKEQKIQVGKILTKIIDADGVVDQHELDLLYYICDMTGIGNVFSE